VLPLSSKVNGDKSHSLLGVFSAEGRMLGSAPMGLVRADAFAPQGCTLKDNCDWHLCPGVTGQEDCMAGWQWGKSCLHLHLRTMEAVVCYL
jgi:hypothetical protein